MVIEIPQLYKKNMPPPFIMYKSNGALKYEATDLGTICNRVEQFHPNKIFYVIDKRQELSMFLVFNAANNIKLFKIEDCEFIGFGTINGVDGKPLKTRNGNAATLQTTINETYEAALKIISNNKNANYDKEQIKTIAYYVALSSLKFADLSNSFSTDYIYDVEKFTQFEGKTGPYILYTAVRIKSILKTNSSFQDFNIIITNDFEKNIIINLSKYSTIISEC
jgi:arginyl-tRNA synthetase